MHVVYVAPLYLQHVAPSMGKRCTFETETEKVLLITHFQNFELLFFSFVLQPLFEIGNFRYINIQLSVFVIWMKMV
jgi:hypothetical protein